MPSKHESSRVRELIRRCDETVARSKELERQLNLTAKERKKAQTELSQSRQRFRLIAENLHEVLWLTDSERKTLLYVSPQCDRIFFKTAADFESDPRCFLPLVHPDDRPAVQAYLDSSGGGEAALSFRIHAPDGSVRWLSDRRFPVTSESGKVQSLVGITEDITDRKLAEERLQQAYSELEERVGARTKELQRANEDIRRLANHLDCVREEESRRMAQEVHDVLGQTLTVAKMQLALLKRKGPKLSPADLGSLEELLVQMGDDVRRISYNLRPMILDHFGIQAALEWMAENFQKTTGLPVTVRADEKEVQLSPEASIAVFRICQEALSNAVEHGQAKHVEIRLSLEDSRAVVEIADDGIGFVVNERHDHSLGLLGMNERALRLGGHLQIISSPGQGTTVRLEIPDNQIAPEKV